jgi:hypothetical protein
MAALIRTTAQRDKCDLDKPVPRGGSSLLKVEKAEHVDPAEQSAAHAANADAIEQGNVTRGRATSGRSWKKTETSRTSTLGRDGTPKTKSSWEKKQRDRAKRDAAKAAEAALKAEIKDDRVRASDRRRERAAQVQKNELKSAQYVPLKDGGLHAVKAMSKKQLRQIKKTRIDPNTGQVELVSLYAKPAKAGRQRPVAAGDDGTGSGKRQRRGGGGGIDHRS